MSGRIVAIDFGHKRVGVATSDPLRMFAQPRGAWPPEEVFGVLEEMNRTDGIELLVVGWPLMPDGSEGEMTRHVQRFIDRLRKRLPGITIEKVDERYSSETAKTRLHEAGRSARVRADRSLIDAEAAAVLLTDYLNETG
jgi:putative holliday junction resolvase